MSRTDAPGDVFLSNLRALISATGWSQAEMGRRAGVSPRMIGKVMNGECQAGLETIEGVASAFKLDAWQLLVPGAAGDCDLLKESRELLDLYFQSDNGGRDYILATARREATKAPPDVPSMRSLRLHDASETDRINERSARRLPNKKKF